jgi:hypothetical protein
MMARPLANQTKIKVREEEAEAKVVPCQEEAFTKAVPSGGSKRGHKRQAAINSVRLDLEQTIQRRMEDALLCVDQKAQSLHTVLSEIIEKNRCNYRQ